MAPFREYYHGPMYLINTKEASRRTSKGAGCRLQRATQGTRHRRLGTALGRSSVDNTGMRREQKSLQIAAIIRATLAAAKGSPFKPMTALSEKMHLLNRSSATLALQL